MQIIIDSNDKAHKVARPVPSTDAEIIEERRHCRESIVTLDAAIRRLTAEIRRPA
jgi:hypothetical protein